MIEKAITSLWNFATDQCPGGRATTAILYKFLALVAVALLISGYIAWPWAKSEYLSWKAERATQTQAIIALQQAVGLNQALGSAKDQEQDARLDKIEPRVDRLSDRVSRLEGPRH